ncbi:MAG: pteridine reductase [Gammaproteobacteria bacterium]
MAGQGTHQTLEGKAVLLTGAARRIGASMARAFHAAGANVVIHYRGSRQEADTLADELRSERPDSAAVVRGDLLDTASLPGMVNRAAEAFGRLDVLVNNASTFYPTEVGSITEAEWDDLVGTNLKAPLFLAQAAASWLKESRGLIINMVDIHARRPLQDHSVYCAAKAGLAMLTYSLARDLGPEVRVNGIAPGAILWPESGVEDTDKAAVLAEVPLGRAGDPADIAAAAVFMAQDAGYVTGQILAVDGGRSAGF